MTSKKDIEELKESMDMMDELLDNAYYGMVLVDAEGYIIKWNYEKLMGLSEKDVLGKHVKDVIENTRLHIVAKTGRKELCDIQAINGQKVITSRIPIMKNGKPLGAAGTVMFSNISELHSVVRKVKTLEDDLSKYKGELSQIYQTRFSFEDILSRNEKMIALINAARRITRTSSTVLIQGESGTGKELFAHAIHRESSRKHGNFVTINCGAIPKDLLESELFGYEEGAFTGAKKGGKIGKFELAGEGTLLLDEIGSMPMDMQAKLLRVLESKEFERIGAHQPIPLKARILSSTHDNLEVEVAKGSFRGDLYYRLNVIRLNIPPLRDRLEDIELISHGILEKLVQDLNTDYKVLSKDALETLKQYHWPGNVRELRNILERAVNFTPGEIIEREHLPDYLLRGTQENSSSPKTLKEIMEEREIEILKSTLKKVNNNRSLAAQRLGIHRTSLYKKLEKYQLDKGSLL